MPEHVIYSSKKYKLTPTSFTYQGHTEPLKNIADLHVIENGRKQKIIAGLTLSVWGVLFSFFPGYLMMLVFAAMSAPTGENISFPHAQTINIIFFASLFFIIGYTLRAKYRLIITKSNGASGTIGKNKKSREEFDRLISEVKKAIGEYC